MSLVVLLIVFSILVGATDAAFCGEPDASFPEFGPDTKLITCYISVTSLADEPFQGVDLLPVYAPFNASVTQIMMLAQAYHENFWYESSYDELYGTFIYSINGIGNYHPWYWFLYDVLENSHTNCGTDYTRARPNDHFHWLYGEWRA